MQLLVDFLKANHKMPDATDNKYLYEWLKDQKRLGGRHQLPADKYKQLAEAGVQFTVPTIREAKPARRTMAQVMQQLEENWQKKYQELIAFRFQNPDKWPTLNSQLGKWCSAQKNAATGKIKYKLPVDRIEKLNKIGFVWRTPEAGVPG